MDLDHLDSMLGEMGETRRGEIGGGLYGGLLGMGKRSGVFLG